MNRPNSNARDQVANLVIVVLCLFIAAALGRAYFYEDGPEGKKTEAKFLPGSRFPLQRVNWEGSERTLLLILDDSCPYSAESMPFYQQLVKLSAGRSDVRLIGIFETSVESGKEYLMANGLRVEVIAWPFRMSKIFQTPNLILVNRAGEVTRQWAGLLSPAGEADVINQLFGMSDTAGEQARRGDVPPADLQGGLRGIVLPDLLELMKERRVTLLDVDARESYTAEHIAGAKNIPLDELYIRALNELDQRAHIVLYTRNYNRFFLAGAQVLEKQGFENVRILRGGLEAWKSAGQPVAGGQGAKQDARP
jgi:rhodanese-related sulfurtransferase